MNIRPGKVLIVKLGAIGDVVMAIPAVYELSKRGMQVDWICGPGVSSLLGCYPWIRTIVVDDRAILKGSLLQRVRALMRLWKVVGARRYDLCATLYYDERYRLLTFPVIAQRRVRLSHSSRAGRLLPGRHHSDEYDRVLSCRPDGYEAGHVQPLRPTNLPRCPLQACNSTGRIGLVPGGASNMLRQQTLRRWPIESYAAVTQELLERGYEVVLLGGPDDAWVRPQFSELLSDGRVIDTIGSVTLPEMIAVCDSCDVVVSHDTGPLHLAALSTASVIGLFGPTDPGSFLPRRNGVRGIWGGEGFACRPCYDGRDFPACSNNGCMQQITVDMVMRQIDAFMQERSLGPSRDVVVLQPSGLLEES